MSYREKFIGLNEKSPASIITRDDRMWLLRSARRSRNSYMLLLFHVGPPELRVQVPEKHPMTVTPW